MPKTPPRGAVNTLRAYGPRLLRYSGVTVVNTAVGVSLLVIFFTLAGWPGVWANSAAVMLSTIPAYYLSRKWVWNQSGPNSLMNEVVPFWALALAGLVLSSIMVGWASARWSHELTVYAANLASFGLLWVVKFFVLEKLLWGEGDTEVVATEVNLVHRITQPVDQTNDQLAA